MNRDLPHLIGQVFNTPLMIQGQKLETILDAVGARILAGAELSERTAPEPRAAVGSAYRGFEHGGYLADDGIAVLPVLGTLVRRGSWLDSVSGMMSYAKIARSVMEMASDPSVRGIMMEVDSFGGEAGGVFDLAKCIRDTASLHGKPIWAVANEAAASAGYAIACAADRIWLPQMGEVGSIGVVTAHVDVSKADENAGVKWTYIFAGEHKVDGNPHEPLAASVKAEIKADIDQVYGLFVDLVASNRGMSAESVRATQARMYRGDRAVEAGLADEVGTFAEAMNAFATHLGPKARVPQKSAAVLSYGRRRLEMDAAAVIVPPVMAAAPDAAAAERARSLELTKIAGHAARLGVEFDLSKAIVEGVRPDAARAAVLNMAADNDERTQIFTFGTSSTAAEANQKDRDRANFDKAIGRVTQMQGIRGAAHILRPEPGER